MSVASISSQLPFLPTLAQLVLDECAGDLTRLADYTVLVPTRRAERALREAFLALRPDDVLLLPRITPLGDVDDDELVLRDPTFAIPPAINPYERAALLSQLVARANPGLTPAQSLELAEVLARLLDQAQTYGVDLNQLHTLVPENYAAHWDQTLTFLKIITHYWPQELAARGMIDAADYRNRVLRATAALWQAAPPTQPVIAAGSVGAFPATAELLAVIAQLPNGRVILPGLDTSLEDDVWDILPPTHPQYAMQRLLARMQITRDSVTILDKTATPPCVQLWRTVMLPAAETTQWRDALLPNDATNNLTYIECAHSEEEAQLIALTIRATLEQPDKTVALVTPDRNLAMRVRAALRRWQITVDDSAGTFLSNLSLGVYLQLLTQVAGQPDDWVMLLALLKHPLTALGQTRADTRQAVRQFELDELRRKSLAEHIPVGDILERFRNVTAAWHAVMHSQTPQPLSTYLKAHVAVAEAAAARADDLDFSIWARDDGRAACSLFDQLLTLDAHLPPLLPRDYAEMIAYWLQGVRVRPVYNLHPRVFIWGVLEAQLQHVDHVIIGGFNDSNWPPAERVDPWLSRPMQAAIGLPSYEFNVGLNAHDVTQLAALPQATITRALRSGGSPQLASRWLTRLNAVLKAQGRSLYDLADTRCHGWLQQLTHAPIVKPATRPAPVPPLSARPRSLSVTAIERLRRDPYSIYAQYILRLKILEPLNPDPGGAERGTLLHKILADFTQRYSNELPPNATAEFLKLAQQVIGKELLASPFGQYLWPRVERHAEFFVAQQQDIFDSGRRSMGNEINGEISWPTLNGAVTIKAIADRIDRDQFGNLTIIDYKTGAAPSERNMLSGYAPQLPLEAVIAQQGGFAGIAAAGYIGCEVWQLGQRDDAVNSYDSSKTDAFIATTQTVITALLNYHLRDNTPFLVAPRPDYALAYNDYEQLSRAKEWGGQ